MQEILGESYNSVFAHPNLAMLNTQPPAPALGDLANLNALGTVQTTLPRKRAFCQWE